MIISIRGWLSASYGLTSTATITVHHDADRILKSGRKCPSSTSVAYAYFKAYSLSSPVRNGSATTWLTYDWIYVQNVSHRHFFMDLYIYLQQHPLPTCHRICSISFISLSSFTLPTIAVTGNMNTASDVGSVVIMVHTRIGHWTVIM